MGSARKSALGARLIVILAAVLSAQAPARAGADDEVHPSFDLTPLRPAGYEPRVAGMDFLPGGRLAIATWRPNEVHVLDGAGGPPSKAAVRKAAGGFTEIMGLCTSGDTIFVADQAAIYRLEDRDRNGLPETKVEIGKLPYTGSFHEWSFGLVRKDGLFYTALSVATTRTGRTLVPQKDPRRGAVVSMDSAGAVEVIATGLRAPEGLGLGPGGSIWATDNQGSWLPASKLIHVEKGRTYGHRIEPAGAYDTLYPTPPAVWLPYGETSKSPTQAVFATAGRYAGQAFYGDIATGAVRRAFVEEVGGAWQGCVMRFSGGFEAAVHRLVPGKDGSLWTGGLGNGDEQNWGWRGRRFGLQRLVPNGKPAFEVHAMRARAGGFEIEFSEPPGPEALKPASYAVKRWWYEPTSAYGGPKKDLAACRVKFVRPSADGKRVFVEIDGLLIHHVIHVRMKGLKSRSGRSNWTPDAWYTLNAFSSRPFAP
jgi:hypothetical protein